MTTEGILFGVLLVALVAWFVVRRLIRGRGIPPDPLHDGVRDATQLAAQAPRDQEVAHGDAPSTPEPRARREEVVNEYFRLTDLVVAARATGQYVEAIGLAKHAWPLIPRVLRDDFGGVSEVPAIDVVLDLLVAAGDEASLIRLREIVQTSRRLADLRQSTVEEALEGLALSRRIVDAVAHQPGVLQKDLDELLGVKPETVREHCYWMAQLKRLERRKKGSSYALFPSSEPIPAPLVGADGLPVVRRICPSCQEEIRGTPQRCRSCGRDLRKIWPGSEDGEPYADYPVEVVGESYRQAVLESIVGGRDRDGAEHEASATLILENDNPHDDQAVRVEIESHHVGYLSRADARRYREFASAPTKVPALIVGGWDRGEHHLGSFGVRLALKL